MAVRKPSDRRRTGIGEGPGEPDLTPMMNLTFMLILALLTLSSIFPMGLITVQAPRISSGGAGPSQPIDQEKKLNLTIIVRSDGYNIGASGAILSGANDEPPREGETLYPKVQRGGESYYDVEALNRRLIQIKKSFPAEEGVIITAEDDVVYDDIVKTMDAARESADKTPLFPAVAFSAGVMG